MFLQGFLVKNMGMASVFRATRSALHQFESGHVVDGDIKQLLAIPLVTAHVFQVTGIQNWGNYAYLV